MKLLTGSINLVQMRSEDDVETVVSVVLEDDEK